MKFYEKNDNLDKILKIINGNSKISLRLIDWFSTNYSKKNYIVYTLRNNENKAYRFKVYIDYKLKLKAYSKKRFDPFCRWDRINIPYKNDTFIQTTIGQLNFFRWVLENKIIDYIEKHYDEINNDMIKRNSSTKNKKKKNNKIKKSTRKMREELSVSASKSIKKEEVEIVVSFK
jgi:hypothetical protein